MCYSSYYNGCSSRPTDTRSIPCFSIFRNLNNCFTRAFALQCSFCENFFTKFKIVSLSQKINDAGRSLVVHCFGAYFGLAAAKVCHRQNTMVVDDDESSGHSSELFAMLGKNPRKYRIESLKFIGTLFIWSFFPSFNAGSIPHSTPEMRHRAFLNSYLAMVYI